MTTRPLTDWLASMKQREVGITVRAGRPTPTGDADPLDHVWAERYSGALLHARDHKAWWLAVRAAQDAREAFAAVVVGPDTCVVHGCEGDPEVHDGNGVPFCTDHDPAWWHARLPGEPEPEWGDGEPTHGQLTLEDLPGFVRGAQ